MYEKKNTVDDVNNGLDVTGKTLVNLKTQEQKVYKIQQKEKKITKR